MATSRDRTNVNKHQKNMGFSDSVQIEHLNGRVKNLIEKIREEIGIEILILNLKQIQDLHKANTLCYSFW